MSEIKETGELGQERDLPDGVWCRLMVQWKWWVFGAAKGRFTCTEWIISVDWWKQCLGKAEWKTDCRNFSELKVHSRGGKECDLTQVQKKTGGGKVRQTKVKSLHDFKQTAWDSLASLSNKLVGYLPVTYINRRPKLSNKWACGALLPT